MMIVVMAVFVIAVVMVIVNIIIVFDCGSDGYCRSSGSVRDSDGYCQYCSVLDSGNDGICGYGRVHDNGSTSG